MKRLYEHIENTLKLVSDKFNDKISWQNYEENKPDSVGIVLLDSRNSEKDISGETEWECYKLELRVICDKSEESIFENQDIIRKFVDLFEECESTLDNLEIIWASYLGNKVKPNYINGYGLPECKCIIDFNYIFLD